MLTVMPLLAESPSISVRVTALPTISPSIIAFSTMVSFDSSMLSATGVTASVAMPNFSPSAIMTLGDSGARL